MARLNLFAALPVIGLLMCGTAHAEDKAPSPPPVAPAPGAPVPPITLTVGKPTDAERQAAHEEMRKKIEAMTPDQRKAFFEERRKEMQAHLAAMSPEDRAQFEKTHPDPAGHHPEAPSGMMKPPLDGEHKAPPAPPAGDHKAPAAPAPKHEKGQPPLSGQPSSDKH